MDFSKTDLNLLIAFEALFRTQNVSLAAENIGLSQSTMSYALAKLRRQFDDRLFVRTSQGMQPTSRALHLAEPIQRALDILRNEVLKQARFDPSSDKRVVTLCMTDIAEINFLPKLLGCLAQEAPNVDLKTIMMDRTLLEAAMAAGDVDLAVGYFPDFKKAGVFQQRLFPHTFVCAVRNGHPRIGAEITIEQFLNELHITVGPDGRSNVLVERMLEKRGVTRRVVLNSPQFTSIPLILAESDLVCTVPRKLGEAFSKLADLKLVPLPFAVPSFDVKQYWHERFHNDEANKWLRKKIAELFMEK